jgi:outer membrane protein assembly factor BamB
MPAAVTTRSYDNARTGATTTEPTLTSAAVGTRGIRRVFSLATTGDRRGIEAQPLAVPGVQLADGSVHDVIYLADMANQVWAFDAATGQQLWKRTLGTPVNGGKAIDMYTINDHWGVLGTPVIDLDTGTMYLVAWVSTDGSILKARHYCYAVSIRDGSDAHPRVDLQGARYDAGHGTQPQLFDSAARKQRAGLVLTKVDGEATVFIAFGSVRETGKGARGWVIACATKPLAVTAAWSATAKGWGGGIWQGAGGLAADDAGAIYAMTGNGTFDGVTDFAESFVKLNYTPPAGGKPATLNVVDWWTPFTDSARIAANVPAPAPAHAAAPTNFRALAASAGMEGWDDMDLASGGPVLVPSHNAALGAGKDGVLYVVKLDDMGQTTPVDLADPTTNYAKLLSSPIFFTYYPANLSPCPDDIRTLNVLWGNVTHHLHGNPIFWTSPDHGSLVYCWGENGNLRAWSLNADGSLAYLACSAESASAQSPVPSGGMPGGMITVSADETTANSGVVWATVPYTDANREVSAGRLIAYDATQFGTFGDGSNQIHVLWDSQDWNIPFSFNKFNRPIVFNGRLYVPTYDARVDVYELA